MCPQGWVGYISISYHNSNMIQKGMSSCLAWIISLFLWSVSGNETDPTHEVNIPVVMKNFVYIHFQEKAKKTPKLSLFYQLYTVFILNKIIVSKPFEKCTKHYLVSFLRVQWWYIFASRGFSRGAEWIINPWLAKMWWYGFGKPQCGDLE